MSWSSTKLTYFVPPSSSAKNSAPASTIAHPSSTTVARGRAARTASARHPRASTQTTTTPIMPSRPIAPQARISNTPARGPAHTCRSGPRRAHSAGAKVATTTMPMQAARSGRGNPRPVRANRVAAAMTRAVAVANAAKPIVALPDWSCISLSVEILGGFSSTEHPECISGGRDLPLDATGLIENVAGRSPKPHRAAACHAQAIDRVIENRCARSASRSPRWPSANSRKRRSRASCARAG